MDIPCCPQHLLEQWVVGCLAVGAVLLLGGARAAGAALVGSSFCSFLAYPLKGLYGGDHLETLVHGAVILGSVGLVGFGLAGLALGADHPLGRYPVALVPAIGTVVVGTLLILRIQEEAAPSCSLMDARPVTNASSPFAASCFRGFEDPWLQALLWFQRRLPRAAVPGAGVAGVAVIGEVRTGGRPVGLVARFLSLVATGRRPSRCHRLALTCGPMPVIPA
jgi:hypothetical protein